MPDPLGVPDPCTPGQAVDPDGRVVTTTPIVANIRRLAQILLQMEDNYQSPEAVQLAAEVTDYFDWLEHPSQVHRFDEQGDQ